MSFIAVILLLGLILDDFRRPIPRSPIEPIRPKVRGKAKGRLVYGDLDVRSRRRPS